MPQVAAPIREFIAVEPWEEREGALFPGRLVRVRGVVLGNLPNKSNSRKIVTNPSGRPLVIKSAEARAWERRVNGLALACAGQSGLPITGALALVAVVYYPDMRRDLDIELLPDALQRAGIIANDRSVWHKECTRRIDAENPRVEFELTPWDPHDQT